MIEHAIFGDGNLGRSFLNQTLATSDCFTTHYPGPMLLKSWGQVLNDTKTVPPRFLWFCVGGSHHLSRIDELKSYWLNVELPAILLDHVAPETHVCFFSTADCVNPSYPNNPDARSPDPHRTIFAKHKSMLEGFLVSRNRPRTTIVRLSTLYGSHCPEATFPGRLLRTKWPNHPLTIPSNEIIPTPTDWLAELLLERAELDLFSDTGTLVHHVAPIGSVSSLQWAKMIMHDNDPAPKFLERTVWDSKRPKTSALGCSLDVKVDHWSILWSEHFKREAYQAKGD